MIPLVNANQESIIEFTQKYIVYKFRIVETITNDQGSVFTCWKMQEISYEMGIKSLTSTLYHTQTNGQVEAANKVIIGFIKKHVGKNPKN